MMDMPGFFPICLNLNVQDGDLLKSKSGKIHCHNNVAELLCGTSVCPLQLGTSNFVKQCSAVLNLPFLGFYLQDSLLRLE